MSPRHLIVWGYVFELLLSALLFGLLVILWSPGELSKFIQAIATGTAAFFSTPMFAGAIAFLWAYYAKSDSQFAIWLYSKGAFQVYLFAYIFAIAVYGLLTAALVIADVAKESTSSFIALWLLILGVINVYSFTRNVVDQLKLNMEFNRRKQ